MRILVSVLALGLTSCGPSADIDRSNVSTPDVQNSGRERTEANSVDELGYPTKQPDGSQLTAKFCGTDEAERIYDNIKTCSMVACDQGNAESCKIAETFATQHAPSDRADVE